MQLLFIFLYNSASLTQRQLFYICRDQYNFLTVNMFRRLSSSLPKDPEFPADLEALGYFVNEKDQIRSITRPDHEFNFFISKNERVCETQREAMNTCIRQLVQTRLLSSSLNLTRVPFTASPTDPHIPILTSTNLPTANRTILFFGEEFQDLGIFAYRTIGQESNAAGSAVDFVSAIQSSKDNPGIIIANLGQLLWYRRGGRAVTRMSWSALPRNSGVAEQMRIDPVKNRVPGNEDAAAHVKYVFEEVVAKMVNPSANLDIIGVGEGASELVAYLQTEWAKWEGRIQAIAVGAGYMWTNGEVHDAEFAKFWGKRARVYLLSPHPLETPLSGREHFGCNCYSSGEAIHTECIMPRAYRSMLGFFRLVADVPGYQEVEDLELAAAKGVQVNRHK